MTDDEPYGDVPRLPERLGTCHYDPDTGEYVMPGDFMGEKELRWRPGDVRWGTAPSRTDDVAGDVASDEAMFPGAGNMRDSGNLNSAEPCSDFHFVPMHQLEALADNELLTAMAVRFERCLAIARAKNADYAGDADVFANFRRSELVGVPVARGILVRLTDKLARISNLLDKPPAVADERLTDTIDDAISYLAILGAWLDAQR
jgi:hypothetical protein